MKQRDFEIVIVILTAIAGLVTGAMFMSSYKDRKETTTYGLNTKKLDDSFNFEIMDLPINGVSTIAYKEQNTPRELGIELIIKDNKFTTNIPSNTGVSMNGIILGGEFLVQDIEGDNNYTIAKEVAAVGCDIITFIHK